MKLSQCLPKSLFFLASAFTAVEAQHFKRQQPNFGSCFTSNNITALLPSDPTYANASQSYNERLQYSPAAIVYPNNAQDVQNIVKCVSGASVPVVARSGGHSYAAYGVGGQNGSLVVDLSRMKSLTVDATTGYAVSGTGNLLGDLATGIWNQGQRALPHGTCPYVGTGGHAAYGGFGLYSRATGLLLDTVVSADVVLANGTLVTASSSSNQDLFWAIRGAAPSFGIVTAWTFATLPAPPTTISWQITYTAQIPEANLVSVLNAWQSFAFSNPTNELSFLLDVSLDGQGSLHLAFSGAFYGDETTFASVITPFQNSLPGNTSLVTQTYNWIDGLTAVDGALNTTSPEPRDNFFAKSIMANQPFSNDSWSSWISYMLGNTPPTGLTWYTQIDLYGGAISAIAENATAYAHRDSVLNFQFYGSAPSEAFPADGISFMNGLVSALTTTPYAAYPNYIDPTLTPAQWQSLYFGSHYERLTTIKQAVDPNNLFSFPQAIGLAASNSTTTASPSPKKKGGATSQFSIEKLTYACMAFLLAIL